MKNMLMGILVLTSLYMASCSGYLNQHDLPGDTLADTLAIANGGGYLSGPSNDISPYLFRDLNDNNPKLFFSSDRAGTYDLYVAPMRQDGTFESPRLLPSPINNASFDEKYPVIFYAQRNNGGIYEPRVFISFYRDIGGNSWIYTYETDPGFTNFTFRSFFDHTYQLSSLNISPDRENFYPTLWIHDSYFSTIRTHDWSGFDTNWFVAYTNQQATPLAYIKSMHHFQNGNNAYGGEVFVMEYYVDYREQIYLAYNFSSTDPPALISQFYPVAEYESSYNDRWPFVDYSDDGKLYFSSDRGENGDYDLFRYNYYSISNLIPVNPYVTTNRTQEET